MKSIDLDALRHDCSILDLLPADSRVRQTGKDSWVAGCLFHDDKNPAMRAVYLDFGWAYHCHACHAKGDVINFVMRSQGLTFKQAIAQMAGVSARYDIADELPKPLPGCPRSQGKRKGFAMVCDSKDCVETLPWRRYNPVETERATVSEIEAMDWTVLNEGRRTYCPMCTEHRRSQGLVNPQRPSVACLVGYPVQ